ncbi:major facilitator superfamily domain-containing protein [Phthorimaea operculella]|nr:major facilitator superfamily domain-containing protein [Phthorimaea operculella]
MGARSLGDGALDVSMNSSLGALLYDDDDDECILASSILESSLFKHAGYDDIRLPKDQNERDASVDVAMRCETSRFHSMGVLKKVEGGSDCRLANGRRKRNPVLYLKLLLTNGFFVWFPTILNALATHNGQSTRVCEILEASILPAHNGTNVTVTTVCNDVISTDTFIRSIYIGLVFCSMYIIVGFLVDYVGKKIILVVVLTVTGACGIGAHLATSQQVAVVLFALFQMSGACIGLMNAVAVELFPTKYRAMAVCLSMMTGRAGSMVGTNLIGYLLTSNCGTSFYIFGGIVVVNGLICFTLPIPLLKRTTKVAPAPNTATNTPTTVDSTQYQTHEPA